MVVVVNFRFFSCTRSHNACYSIEQLVAASLCAPVWDVQHAIDMGATLSPALLLHTHRAIGDLYNFHLDPSLTLGCGSWGSTSVSANVGPQHLINVKTVAQRQENMLWFKAPPKIYFKRNSLDLALQELKGL